MVLLLLFPVKVLQTDYYAASIAILTTTLVQPHNHSTLSGVALITVWQLILMLSFNHYHHHQCYQCDQSISWL